MDKQPLLSPLMRWFMLAMMLANIRSACWVLSMRWRRCLCRGSQGSCPIDMLIVLPPIWLKFKAPAAPGGPLEAVEAAKAEV